MRALIQRVKMARVDVNGETVGAINSGLLTLLGVQAGDDESMVKRLCEKVCQFRVFADEAGKMNRSLLDTGGGHLIVSQFTLAANCQRGRRPSFDSSAPPELARDFYNQFVSCSEGLGLHTETGRFGEDMQVHLQNDGPVTFLLEV